MRTLLYALARLLGDVGAVVSLSPARMARRVRNRAIGRALGRLWRL